MYNPLLLGIVTDAEDVVARAMNFAPSMWLNPLPDSGNGFGTVIFESAFAAADVGCSEFAHITKIGDPPISFADAERLQYQDVWNDSDYAEFSVLWNLNTVRRLKKRELRKNTNVVTGKLVRHWKIDVIKPKSRIVARRFGQIHTVDCSEPFALTPSAVGCSRSE